MRPTLCQLSYRSSYSDRGLYYYISCRQVVEQLRDCIPRPPSTPRRTTIDFDGFPDDYWELHFGFTGRAQFERIANALDLNERELVVGRRQAVLTFAAFLRVKRRLVDAGIGGDLDRFKD
ncbi:uncharacterized protein MONBRDRAFT_11638 [Monosiga brevicollis MX1]|uniref:Uncharacterized protein n=1 Tax=Monosiga brevicollis TaxID=81824 RepID=A9V9V3_MONBE|nr:uncharacterized protein MONBRDRAFT_11638 [Monosiga brevicollis MX1]EDQ85731.1 predicted protein [Monosiga brevicollis MX1]|eukprot:XP_001749446.1 hypothetical protein [Monosiga brevicollis MX1]